MAVIERAREPASDRPLDEQVAAREGQGWSLVALEWQRRLPGRDLARSVLRSTEVPYGLQVASDYLHLEENPLEVEAMIVMLDLMVEDRPLSEVADELNRRSMTTRSGGRWTPSKVFDLVPRLVEVGPDIFGTDDWSELRERRRSLRPVAV